jgi:heptosyltransferase-3
MNRILVIRGGAIGDFVLTLPALKALRDAYPKAEIEILGYSHIAELTHKRFYAGAVRSIEYALLSRFFARGSELPAELADYFASFDVVISYLYDPDLIFANNLERCGVRDIVRGPAKIAQGSHAARQLAEPMKQFGLEVKDLAARFYPAAEDRRFAEDFLEGCAQPVVALHPGSGSEKKNWPIEKWIELGNAWLGPEDFGGSILIIAGEADEARAARLESAWKSARVRLAKNLPLPRLGAVLERTVFMGHDSGISHLAAAAGADCVLLFGQTDPAVWAPQGENVKVIRAPRGDINALEVATVRDALERSTRECARRRAGP